MASWRLQLVSQRVDRRSAPRRQNRAKVEAGQEAEEERQQVVEAGMVSAPLRMLPPRLGQELPRMEEEMARG